MKKSEKITSILLWAFVAALLLRPIVVCLHNAIYLMAVQVELQDDPPETAAGATPSFFEHQHLLKKIEKQKPRSHEFAAPMALEIVFRSCSTPLSISAFSSPTFHHPSVILRI